MKILFFARLFYPHIGGVEKHVMEISKLLIKKGHTITVLTENYEDLPEKEIINGIEIIRLSIDDKSSKIKIWKEVLNHIKAISDADVVHVHDVFFWYLPFRFLFRLKKVYMTFHGYEGNDLPTKKAIFMHKIAEKLSFGNICIGDYLKKWYGTKPTIVSYGAVNIPKKIPGSLTGPIRKILYIGRLEAEAGILEYLETLLILKKSGFKLRLTVLGDGSQRKKAEEFVKKNKLNVDFKGFVREVYEFISDADAVFSSRYLGTLESFVFKKRVFVVYNNAIKKDCFFLSPFNKFIVLENDPNKIADAFKSFEKDKDKARKITDEEYDWIKDQTWNKLTNQYLTLWNK